MRPVKSALQTTGQSRGRESGFSGRRPFLWPGVSLALGILLGRFFSIPSLPVFFFLFFLLPFLWYSRGRRFFLPLFLLAMIGTGILRIHQAHYISPDNIVNFANGEWASLEGRIVSLPELKQKGKRRIYSFVLEAENLVRLREFFELKGKAQIFLFNPSEAPSYGDKVRLRGKLILPKIPHNPGEFNYRKYLAEQSIYAIFEGYGARSLKKLPSSQSLFSYPLTAIQELRNVCARRLDSLFQYPISALLKALILGLKKDLPESFREDFMKTNTSHLIAISGMNITLVAGSLFLISLFLGLPQKGAAVMGILATAGYVFLSGAGLPVVRAGWMAGLFFTGLLLEREKDLANSLFFAFFSILVFDPLALFQVGFQLSFLCVLSLVLFSFEEEWIRGREWLQTAVVLIGTFPLCIVYFNIFSWTSLLTNLLAIPLFHLGVLGGLGALLAGEIPFLGPLFIQGGVWTLKAGVAWIHFWANKSWGYVYLQPPSWKSILFYYGALGGVLLIQKFPRLRFPLARPLSLSLWLAAALLFFLPSEKSRFALTVFASGQNEILHVEFPEGGHWLVNTGRAAPSNQARWILNPFLRRSGVSRLAGIFLTDFSKRHSGGLETLLGNFSVTSLFYPADLEIPPGFKFQLQSRRMRRVTKVPLREVARVSVEKEGGFQILSVKGNHVFLTVYYRDQKFLLLPTWKSGEIRQALPQLKRLSSVEVLILPASGRPEESLWQEILSSLLPQQVVLTQKKPAWEPLIQSLLREEIPVLFLSETGALRFEAPKG